MGQLFVHDKNVAACAATKQKSGYLHFFVYAPGGLITWIFGDETKDLSSKTIKVDGDKIVGSNSPLAATTWNDEVRLYYIDVNQFLKELCLNAVGDWYEGALTKKKWRVASSTGLSAAGNALNQADGGHISVLFFDADDHDNLYEATIDVQSRDWRKEQITE